MAAEFTPEQIAILEAVFDQLWARMAALRNDMNETSTRLVTLLTMLAERGIITADRL